MLRVSILYTLVAVLACHANAQTSKAEKTGFWTTGTTWTGGTMPGTLAGGTITSVGQVIVIDGTVEVKDNITLTGANLSINVGDTLVILGNLTQTSSSLSNNGVLIVFGNVTNTLSNDFISGSGKLVVTGNYSNALGANTFSGPSYVFGSTSGFLPAPSVGNASNLLTNDPALFAYQQSMFNSLPVQLVSFSATLTEHRVELYWKTASEVNNDHFLIERSSDGIQFDWLQVIAGSRTSGVEHNYRVFDQNPLRGVSYYRLTQVDIDNRSTVFGIVAVSNTDAPVVSIYPNPTKDIVYLTVESSNYSIVVHDLDGIAAPTPIPLVEIRPGIYGADLTEYHPGVYLIFVRHPGTSSSVSYRVVKE